MLNSSVKKKKQKCSKKQNALSNYRKAVFNLMFFCGLIHTVYILNLKFFEADPKTMLNVGVLHSGVMRMPSE